MCDCSDLYQVLEQTQDRLVFRSNPDRTTNSILLLFLGCVPLPCICMCSSVDTVTLRKDGTGSIQQVYAWGQNEIKLSGVKGASLQVNYSKQATYRVALICSEGERALHTTYSNTHMQSKKKNNRCH